MIILETQKAPQTLDSGALWSNNVELSVQLSAPSREDSHQQNLIALSESSKTCSDASLFNSVEQIWTIDSVKQHWISLDAFKDFIKQKFGRDQCPEQFDAMIEFTDSPSRIAEVLRWKKPYSGVVYAALMLN
ncbi:MAG: hypothetical protein RMY30_038790, partial [Nostoc sp. CmiSLP01]|nr:hypothetical protein [Nostoc sp. CmiSLP01]